MDGCMNGQFGLHEAHITSFMSLKGLLCFGTYHRQEALIQQTQQSWAEEGLIQLCVRICVYTTYPFMLISGCSWQAEQLQSLTLP